MTVLTATTELSDADKRLDVYLSEFLEGYSRTYAQKLIEEGLVLLDGRPAKRSARLKGDEELTVSLPDPEPLNIEAEDIPLDIVYEDEDILIVNKPKGMVVHPAPGHKSGTLVNAVMFHCGEHLSGINGVLRPGIVHRIDRDTTGLLVICKNDAAHRSVAEQLKVHSSVRRYIALVQGRMKADEDTVDRPIGRDAKNRLRMGIDERDGKHAVTHYRVLERFDRYTLIECRLETGRTHQIRVHMASLGHPLAGDELYGAAKTRFNTEGQCLHAKVLGFAHPRTGEYCEWDSPLPEYLEKILNNLRRKTSDET